MSPPLPPILDADRKHILEHTTDLWRVLSGARFFITGGTGFYGKWLLESIAAANDLLGVKAGATILSRDPARFGREVPHLAVRPEFSWLVGDAASFTFPTAHFDFVLHFATTSATKVSAGGTAAIMHTLAGTERVLEFARSSGAKRLLFASSGAVYGRQPAELSHIPEDYTGAPDTADTASAYGEMKRMSELMCATSGLDCVIARGFAFVGPYLPLTDKFAVGSFMRDALAGGPIRIRSNGTPLRSYLHGADLAVWLLTLLVRGRPGTAYNLGSDRPVSMRQLAEAVAAAMPAACRVEVTGTPGTATDRYVPDISRARTELGLRVAIDLEAAIARSIAACLLSRPGPATPPAARRESAA